MNFMFIVFAVLCLVGGYLIGSIMTAVKIAKSKSIDIRKCGSGNAGSTNVLRTFGWKWGLVCFLCDTAKGALSVFIGRSLGVIGSKLGLFSIEAYEVLGCLAMLGAIIGHLLPIFYNFRGGKCVAVALGGLLVMAPIELLIALGAALIFIIVTKTVSVGSVCGTLIAAALVVIRNWDNIPLVTLVVIIATVIITAHLPNIQRIMAGRERKLENLEWEKKIKNTNDGGTDNNVDDGTKIEPN